MWNLKIIQINEYNNWLMDCEENDNDSNINDTYNNNNIDDDIQIIDPPIQEKKMIETIEIDD